MILLCIMRSYSKPFNAFNSQYFSKHFWVGWVSRAVGHCCNSKWIYAFLQAFLKFYVCRVCAQLTQVLSRDPASFADRCKVCNIPAVAEFFFCLSCLPLMALQLQRSLRILSFALQAKLEMDKYLSPQPVALPEPKKSRRDSASVVDQFFGDDQGSPYSINMNVYLPDIAYLRTGLCRPTRSSVPNSIKTEPVTAPFSHPECPVSTNGPSPPTLPEFTSIFNSNSTPGTGINAVDDNNGVFIKQEMQGFDIPQDGPLFQLLNSELDVPHQAVTNSHSHPHAQSMPAQMPAFHDLHLAAQQTSSKPYCGMPATGYPLGPGHFVHPQGQGHSHLKMPYLPPSPPTSEPGSPDRQKELLHNLTPPPSYAATIASKMAVNAPSHPTPTSTRAHATTGSMPVRYNRRTNPDLEKRRIHHCDFPGV